MDVVGIFSFWVNASARASFSTGWEQEKEWECEDDGEEGAEVVRRAAIMSCVGIVAREVVENGKAARSAVTRGENGREAQSTITTMRFSVYEHEHRLLHAEW